MKRIPHLLIIFLTICLVSCSSEDFDESSPQGGPDTDNPTPEPDIPENTATTPCTFKASEITADQTIIVDCVLDLEGKTIDLPANVTFQFDKGDIINGTLNFPDNGNGKIDGRLLNSTLTLNGGVKLIDPAFKFYAVRWEIVEGTTTSDIAFDNNKKLEALMFRIKELGGTTFNINKFDAYFEITKITPPEVFFRASVEAVNIPSDFNLVMTENTHLRTFPAEIEKENGAILSINDVDNVTVTGGTLHGDRDQRPYSPGQQAGQQGQHTMHIQSGRNITIDGVSFVDGSKGGLTIYSKGFFTTPESYKPTTNVTVKNCIFKNNRRMALSLTDGREIFIEGNTFIDSGQDTANSGGGEVGYAINIEPGRVRDENGTLQELQKVFNTYIRKNTETNSRSGFLTVTIGQDITVEDNDIGTRLVYSLTNGTKIINNRFNAGGIGLESWAIFAAGVGETVYNNEISGNEINGYKNGMVIGSNESYVHHNVINAKDIGILITKPNDIRIIDNTITAVDKGIACTNSFINNGEIRGNKITTTKANGFHLYFTGVNQTDEAINYKTTIAGNTFLNTRKITFSRARGITFTDNNVLGGLEVGDSDDIVISENKKIQPDESDGIRLFGANTNISVLNNAITEPSGAARFVCINNNSNNPGAVTDTGNTCN